MSIKKSVYDTVQIRTDADEHVKRAVKDVIEVCGVREELVFSRDRPEHVCISRFFLYSILKNLGHTWMYIGEFMGRNHGAAVMGARRLHKRLECREKHLLRMRDELRNRGWIVEPNHYTE